MPNKELEKKRVDSLSNYVEKLSEKYSKINVVRVDLAYKKPYSENITLGDMENDINHLFSNMRSKPSIFKDIVGYVLKKEHTEDKGMHAHVLFLFNGQKVQKDAYKGDQIGDYWKKITDNKGSYHNCNRNDYEKNGIGMIDHTDKEKKNILKEQVLPYLAKDEQSVDVTKRGKKTKALTRGVLPKTKSKAGRPRKK